jgi:hypothetical protein
MKGQRRWSHRFMFAHKSVLHLSSQRALARMAKTLSFHKDVRIKVYFFAIIKEQKCHNKTSRIL